MGSIFSAPKAPSLPALPAIVDTPVTTAPIDSTSTDSGDPPAGSGGDSEDDAPEITPAQQRVQDILTRDRGRVGTVATSFNGVLSDAVSNLPARKTLLGE
jgi:hypothetical protein